MPQRSKRKVGRPKHPDRPTPLFTTIPLSVYNQLEEIVKLQGRTKSEVLSELVRTYHNRLSNKF